MRACTSDDEPSQRAQMHEMHECGIPAAVGAAVAVALADEFGFRFDDDEEDDGA